MAESAAPGRPVLPVAVLFLLLLAPVSGLHAAALSERDETHYREAFALVEKGAWPAARTTARRAADPLLAKVVTWLWLRRKHTDAGFEETAGFLAAHADWPHPERLQTRAEQRYAGERGAQGYLAWLGGRRPHTIDGHLALIAALGELGRDAEARREIVAAWRRPWSDARKEREFLDRYGRVLAPRDHAARADALLWRGRRTAASRLLGRLPADQRALVRARIALMARSPGVDARIAAVPAGLRDDPGLTYERVRWRRRAGLDSGARDLLLQPLPEIGPEPGKWWVERRLQARKAFEDNDPALAYRLAAAHGQPPGSLGFAEAEWLAGWIALRFLDRPVPAYLHFDRMFRQVSTPVSQARAAYWAGRTALDLDERETARAWFALAARHPATFYGQLASEQQSNAGWQLAPSGPPSPARQRWFEGLELVRIARQLAQVGEHDRLRPFLLALAQGAQGQQDFQLVARLARTLDRPDLAVRTGKLAARRGLLLPREAYPTLPLDDVRSETALLHAVARQESEFNARAISPAGARGLMQLMPRTARETARNLGLGYRKTRLTDDPGYNLRLGDAYLSRMTERFDGSYVLAVAAYNAGPHRAERWIRDFGDPRDPDVDVIDWIERIPFSETRNYVQRVLEGLQVYRVHLSDAEARLALRADLRRRVR